MTLETKKEGKWIQKSNETLFVYIVVKLEIYYNFRNLL